MNSLLTYFAANADVDHVSVLLASFVDRTALAIVDSAAVFFLFAAVFF